jgi:hypothetical protein
MKNFPGGRSFFMTDWEVLQDFAVLPVYRRVGAKCCHLSSRC